MRVKCHNLARSAACMVALAAVAPAAAGEPTRLAATLVSAGDAAALVEFPGGQGWLRLGDSVAGCRLLRVESAAAEFECGARRIRLQLEAGTGRPVGAAPSPAMAVVELPPGALESLAARPQSIALAADFRPWVEDGQLQGWQLARLEPGSAVADLGLRETDVVHAVNGTQAADPAAFAAALRALAGIHSFTLELSRDGLPLTLLVAAPPARAR